MDKKKIIKLAGMVLCVVLITGLGTWLIHIDKQKEGIFCHTDHCLIDCCSEFFPYYKEFFSPFCSQRR